MSSAADLDMLQLATPGVQGLTPYAPGKPITELQREYGITDVIKLASNENPLGCSEQALDAISATLFEINLYPDGNAYRLKQALAEHHQLESNQITIGNGSNDVLELVARSFGDANCEIMYSQYAFAVYHIVTQAIGAQHNVVQAQEWGHDLHAMVGELTEHTRIIYIANPNNPTGTWVEDDVVASFLSKVPKDIIVVFDEAYHQYVDKPGYCSAEKYLSQYPNLIVTRTFSKAYGLAGLRIGYCLSHPAVANILNRVRQPFNGNALALAAAEAALKDKSFVEKSVQLNRQGMAQLEQAFNALSLSYIPSAGNFISVDVGRDATEVYEALLQRGVIVRPVGAYNMQNFLRVSVGLEQQNAQFIEALTQVLKAS